MASLADHPSSRLTKMLLVGDSGAGKTGSLASLAHAGYNVRIIDLDNGIDALKNLLLDPNTPYAKDAHIRVKYKTITEKAASLSATPSAGAGGATVWNRLVDTLNHWKDKAEDLGPVAKWTDKEILVIDSFTLAGIAAFNFSSLMNIGSKNQDQRMVYFHAQNYLENLVQFLYGDDIQCNVIITSHIRWIEDGNNITHGYPNTIGTALSSKIGRYFNSILQVKSDGNKRTIHTVPVSRVELKNAAPLRVKEKYDIKFGLAEFFADVQGTKDTGPSLKVVR